MSYTPGRFWMEQTGSEPSTALFSPARSSLTSWVPTYYTPLVKPIQGLISAFFPVGRLFGTSRPNTISCGHGYQSGSFLIWRHYRASKLGVSRLCSNFYQLCYAALLQKNYLLCLYHVPIMLNLNGFTFTSDNHSLIDQM